MPRARYGTTIDPQTAWADWPDAVKTSANAVVFHVSKGEADEALSLVDEMLADLAGRRRLLAELVNAED